MTWASVTVVVVCVPQRPQSTVDAYFQWKQKALSVFDSVSSAILCEKLGYVVHVLRVSSLVSG